MSWRGGTRASGRRTDGARSPLGDAPAADEPPTALQIPLKHRGAPGGDHRVGSGALCAPWFDTTVTRGSGHVASGAACAPSHDTTTPRLRYLTSAATVRGDDRLAGSREPGAPSQRCGPARSQTGHPPPARAALAGAPCQICAAAPCYRCSRPPVGCRSWRSPSSRGGRSDRRWRILASARRPPHDLRTPRCVRYRPEHTIAVPNREGRSRFRAPRTRWLKVSCRRPMTRP